MTHQQFADAVGVSRGAVQQWESGATAPKRKNQPAVAKLMGTSISELMADAGTSPALAAQLPTTTPDQRQINDAPAPGPANIEQLMAGLAEYLMEMDDYARDNAADVLRRLAANPKEHARAASLFAAAFQSGKRKVA